MANIWDSVNQLSAKDMYTIISDNSGMLTKKVLERYGYESESINQCFGPSGELGAVRELTHICTEMTSQWAEIEKDQNEYALELDNMVLEIGNAESEKEQRLKELEEKIQELINKQNDGTLTDEEKEKLDAYYAEYNSLKETTESDIKNKKGNLRTKGLELSNDINSKVAVAKDYGNKTVEVGTPLAQTEVKGGFFRKLFGKTRRMQEKKDVGEAAVSAGENLLEKVRGTKDLTNIIKAKTTHIPKR